MKIGKNRFQRLMQKKGGVCFDGAHATKQNRPSFRENRVYKFGHWTLTKKKYDGDGDWPVQDL
jgi:hypothetical protein